MRDDEVGATVRERFGQRALDAITGVLSVCETLTEFASIGPDVFLHDTRTQWAVEMGLIRIGEGVNRIPDDLLEAYPGQPWREIIGMRNLAAHQYDDLEPGRVWRTLTVDVHALQGYLERDVLRSAERDGG